MTMASPSLDPDEAEIQLTLTLPWLSNVSLLFALDRKAEPTRKPVAVAAVPGSEVSSHRKTPIRTSIF